MFIYDIYDIYIISIYLSIYIYIYIYIWTKKTHNLHLIKHLTRGEILVEEPDI